jgi:hypothetical protein
MTPLNSPVYFDNEGTNNGVARPDGGATHEIDQHNHHAVQGSHVRTPSSRRVTPRTARPPAGSHGTGLRTFTNNGSDPRARGRKTKRDAHELHLAIAAYLRQRPNQTILEIARHLRVRDADVREALRNGNYGTTSERGHDSKRAIYYFLLEHS